MADWLGVIIPALIAVVGGLIMVAYRAGKHMGPDKNGNAKFVTKDLCEAYRDNEALQLKHLAEKIDLILAHFGIEPKKKVAHE